MLTDGIDKMVMSPIHDPVLFAVGNEHMAETSIIKGLDDFLLSIAPMLSDEGKDEVSSEDEFPAVIL